MGVTDMEIDTNGILCTGQGQSNDFFLTPANLSQFEACLREPTGSMTGGTGTPFGLTQTYNAIVNHLPRANAPNRFRPNAQVLVFLVSDEPAAEVVSGCGAVQPWDPVCVQAALQPLLDLVQGVSDPEAKSLVNAIVGPPPIGCSTAELGVGYIELANASGGQIASACQSDLGTSLVQLFQASLPVHHYRLSHRPLTATLAAAQYGVTLRRRQLSYWPLANTLLFNLPSWESIQPTELLVGYERWVTP